VQNSRTMIRLNLLSHSIGFSRSASSPDQWLAYCGLLSIIVCGVEVGKQQQ
jgi:hypothetical protein